MTIAEQVGQNIARARRRVRLSQEDAAVRASMHRTAIGMIERGERMLRVDSLIKIAGALECDPCELLAGLAWLPGELRIGRFDSPR